MSTTNPTLVPVDESEQHFLSGRFAPIRHETQAERLTVEGDLPDDIAGAFLRNGPNPMFPPLGSYTYPLEGDGMIHGLWIEGGEARYANRYVRSAGLRADEAAGRALFGGLLTPSAPDPSFLPDDGADPGLPFKENPFINVTRHAGHLYALAEGRPPYEITAELETIGRTDFDGAAAIGMCAHPKIDPATGEMIAFNYTGEAPYLTWMVVGADGTVTQPMTPVDGVERGYMIHDFAITARYAVLVVGPLVFDRSEALAGRPPLAWKPELGTRIALVPRDGQSATRWFELDAFWAWHIANAYDDGDQVVIDLPAVTAPSPIAPPPKPGTPSTTGFTRIRLDTSTGSATRNRFDDALTEFPRIDDRLIGARHRYVTVAARSGDPRLAFAEWDRFRRYDVETGESVVGTAGAALGEISFAPREGSTGELDGYYLTYGTDLDVDRSALYIWDAADPAAGLRAKVLLPQRVPHGLHGAWLPA